MSGWEDRFGNDSEERDAVGKSAVQRLVKLPMPDCITRPETGPMQFGEDWPGIFIRGDNAAAYAMYLNNAAEVMECNDPGNTINAVLMRGLADLLSRCKVT